MLAETFFQMAGLTSNKASQRREVASSDQEHTVEDISKYNSEQKLNINFEQKVVKGALNKDDDDLVTFQNKGMQKKMKMKG